MVERFNRTLNDELQRYVQPLNERHLNRLLRNFRQYDNTARPHMAKGVEPPVLVDRAIIPAANDPNIFKLPRKLERRTWLGGLHSSYRWAACFCTDGRCKRRSSVPTAEGLLHLMRTFLPV